jgi:general secretion pathway protein F
VGGDLLGWGMPRYAFEAIGPSGSFSRGTLDAASSASALELLLQDGHTPVALREMSDEASALGRLARAAGLRTFDYRMMFTELAVLLNAGMPVERALAMLQTVASNDRQAMRIGQILSRVRAGEPLSQSFGALVKEAPAYVPRLLAAGEASGRLGDIVTRLADGLSRAKALRDRVVSSLTYPAVLAIAIGVVLWIVFTSVLPRLTPMFDDAGASLPAATEVLVYAGRFIDSYGWAVFIAAVAGLAAFAVLLAREDTRLAIDRFVLRSPIFLALPARYEATRLCRNLQIFLEGGLSLERALAASRESAGNAWFRARMGDAQASVTEGQRLRAAFEKARVLPPLVCEFAAVGEETGRLSAMMGEAAAILDHEVETGLERLTALIVPLATLAMGGLVAAVMAGVVSGILAVNDLAR